MPSTKRPASSPSVFSAVPPGERAPLAGPAPTELLAAGIATTHEEVVEILADAVWLGRLAASLRDAPLQNEDAGWPPWDDLCGDEAAQ